MIPTKEGHQKRVGDIFLKKRFAEGQSLYRLFTVTQPLSYINI